ncbi:DNA polymerase IV [Floricoccus penangensis]|uniref:DNA polymerase IV n=1 Tax=Floricoccus penangensis TaxID=1859475 RepID=A0A9Q5P0K1_9LACT|nr:DNA polymerase IV [Floricoccus penangensis]OFI47851.1 DNA polymerase IV [Floricoccus penangensis]
MLEYPLINDTSRKIIHIDMDAFFASVEERDNPKLIGKPVIIARNPLESGGRGVVSTCNYEARKYGIHSAMSAKEAYELCPQAIFISGNYQKYKEISAQIHEIFHRYTDLVEGIATDEAYLDVTENKINSTSAVKIAKLIQHDIYQEIHLTSSAGVSYNKFLAKLASDFQKPKGLTLITPGEAKDFLKDLPIEKFHGVGKRTEEKLNEIGIYKGSDIIEINPQILIDKLGVMGWQLYLKGHGIHNSKVKSSRPRKSVGNEKTYGKLLYLEEDIRQEITTLSKKVSQTLKEKDLKGKTIVLKIRTADFETHTKRISESEKNNEFEQINKLALQLFGEFENLIEKGIRLLGVTVTGL